MTTREGGVEFICLMSILHSHKISMASSLERCLRSWRDVSILRSSAIHSLDVNLLSHSEFHWLAVFSSIELRFSTLGSMFSTSSPLDEDVVVAAAAVVVVVEVVVSRIKSCGPCMSIVTLHAAFPRF
jgi:hypothetical protein